MSVSVVDSGGYVQITGSGNVFKGKCRLLGIFVSAASNTPTITVYDDAGTGTTIKIADTFTPAAATWYPIPAQAGAGLNVVIGGTVSCTVIVVGG